jgi:hypothetical protein
MIDEMMWIKRDVALIIRRCHECGRYWALDNSAPGRCPCCAERRADSLVTALAAAERVNRALRGALTKAKGANRG